MPRSFARELSSNPARALAVPRLPVGDPALVAGLRVSRGRLSFLRVGATTAVSEAYADSPLRILTPRNHGEAAWAYTGSLGGGLVGGDRLRMEVTLGQSARAFISTQGPTRVYRSAHDCESELHASVGPGAALFLLPDPVACFAGRTAYG